MSKHIEVKHKIQSIGSKIEFNTLLENSMLSDNEKLLMQLYYVQRKDFDYIADIMGYSKAGILKMHKRILKRIETLI